MKHLSRLDIEAIAEKYITAYMELPEVQDMQIYRIEPELFLERVLGLKIDYAHLSYDGSLLGMTSFVEVMVDVMTADFEEEHTLVYYEHRSDEGKRGCYFNVNTPKTPTSNRQVPMLDFVKEAFLIEKKNQELLDLHCQVTIDGYSDFIFINRFGQAQHQGTLNKALRRIIRDCNDEQLLKDENTDLLLPHFSCHSLRHTFTTRMCEAGVNVKVIQDTLGHKDISTTLNIYTDVTKELKRSEFEGLDLYFKAE